jgi:predicted Rossmann fold nucleotide-binding protein DprA/Smf involved in DNA uptake
MTDKLEDARKLLTDRIAELDAERDQLTKALERLQDVGTPARAGRSAARSRGGVRRSRGKRAPRGEREKQLLASIKADPQRRVSDHARRIGVRPQQLYPILNRLIEQEKIEKAGGRYQPKG